MMSRDEFVMHEPAEMTASNICNTVRYLQRMAEAYEAERDEARRLAEEWRNECEDQIESEGYSLKDLWRIDQLRLPWEDDL